MIINMLNYSWNDSEDDAVKETNKTKESNLTWSLVLISDQIVHMIGCIIVSALFTR